MVFYHGVGLKDVGTDLVAPADLLDLASDAGNLLRILLLFQKIQLCFQHLHGLVFVLELGTLILTLYHNTGR